MVDLQTQYQRIKQDIDAGIQEVIESAAFIKGPKVAEFQAHLEAYTGAKHVIPVGNGTDALQIALMGLGLKPGDEVITPTFTFIATAEVVALLGLTPVVVDVDWNTMNIDVEAVRHYKESLARYTMNEEELRQILTAERPDVAFTRLWTMKEAVLKRTGEGLRNDLKNVLVNAPELTTVVSPDLRYVYSVTVC